MIAPRMIVAIVAIVAIGCYTPPSAVPLIPSEVIAHNRQPRLAAPEPASWDFDVDTAIAYARTHGGLARQRRDAEAVAAARIDAAGQLTNPELRLGRTFDSELGAVDRVFVALRIHPDMPWQRRSNVAAARADAAAARARSQVLERDAAAEIRRLYATLAFGEATRDVIDRQLSALTERQRLLVAQVTSGTATQLEAVIAGEDLFDLAHTRADLAIELTRARGELAGRIGIPSDQPWRPLWDLAKLRAIETTFDQAALAARALATRSELDELAHRAASADARAYRERTKRIPWIEGVQIERSVRRTAEWGVFVQLSLPLLSWNGGAIAAADAETRAAIGERDVAAANTLRAVAAAIALAQATGARARELAERIPPLDKAVNELTAHANANPAAVDPVKLLLLHDRHGRAERAVLAAALEHRLALIALAALTGGP